MCPHLWAHWPSTTHQNVRGCPTSLTLGSLLCVHVWLTPLSAPWVFCPTQQGHRTQRDFSGSIMWEEIHRRELPPAHLCRRAPWVLLWRVDDTRLRFFSSRATSRRAEKPQLFLFREMLFRKVSHRVGSFSSGGEASRGEISKNLYWSPQ